MQHARRPLGKPFLIGIGVIALVALVIWVLIPRGKSPISPQTAGAKPVDSKQADAQTPEVKQPDKVLATNDSPPANAPIQIRQGGSSANPNPAPPSQAPVLGHTAGAEPKALPPPAPSAPAPSAAVPVSSLTVSAGAEVQNAVSAGMQKLESGDPVAARAMLSRVLADGRLSEGDRQAIRDELATINDDLVFSPRIAKDDPTVGTYVVQGGDNLIKIAQKLALAPDYRLIARVNRMASLNSLREGQELKIVKGPFHAVVSKSAYRMDIYMGPPDKQDEWVYIRSFRVGLGKDNGTPLGTFTVRQGSKLVDPQWTNPDTGEHFAGGDPRNPIGRRWVGLEGQGEASKFMGYGIHGTIEPDSIGQQRSMGCVRMATGDIDTVWELLGQGTSVVKIVP